MIKEAYCSFEVAKLLKEKGFNEPCYMSYWLRTKDSIEFTHLEQSSNNYSDCLFAPTHQLAMAWLREVYDLHIIAFPYKAFNKKKYCCQVYKTFNLLGCEKYINERLDSYEEAVEAALKYVLEHKL